jgi:hypothetical protein
MANVLYFRDTLTLDSTLLSQLQNVGITPNPYDTLVLGAANCTLTELSSGFNYVILADNLTTSPVISLTAANLSSLGTSVPAPEIGIYANIIASPLTVTFAGSAGANGTAGAKGRDGTFVTVPPDKPKRLPGGNGGAGKDGGRGANGGSVTIRYATAAVAPTASAPGGKGGTGGAGGAGGAGDPQGKPGLAGHPGQAGTAGTIAISQVAAGQAWTGLEADWLTGWSDYRTSVGEYLFRLFDPASQLHALSEFDASIELNPNNTNAATLRTRIIQQETPSGVARDLDMAPDYKDVSAGLLGETQLVLSQYLLLQGTETQDEIASATEDQFSLVLNQLSDRLAESQLDLVSANDGVKVANADWQSYNTQINGLQNQITNLQNQKLSLGDIVSTLGSVVGAITGLATGVGAIVSIPDALAASDNPQSAISKIFSFLATGKSSSDAKSVGGDLSDLMKGASDGITDFTKVYNELSQSSTNSAITQLSQQVATLTMQQMVANLRRQQANDTLVAAQARVTDYAAEVQTATNLLNQWSADQAFLATAVGVMIDVARKLSGYVADDFFIARRALEIYQLEDASTVHFDYGWLHPDQDNNLMLNPLQRAQLCLQSVSTLPTDVITWNDIFVSLNESLTSGFDVVHPEIEVTIDDPTAIASLKSGGGLRFSVGIGPYAATASIPDSIYELKVNNLTLELDGASASGAATLWIQHTGHWIMNPRPATAAATPTPVEFTLFSHLETFNLEAASGPLTSQIPSQPQSPANPGPPFSFWGRGALADWNLFTDSSIGALNLTGLSSVKLTIGCIGLVAQGTTAPTQIPMRPTPIAMAPQPTPDAHELTGSFAR